MTTCDGAACGRCGAARQVAELVPGGSGIPVTWAARHGYVRMIMRYRLSESARQMAAMRRGLATQVHVYFNCIL